MKDSIALSITEESQVGEARRIAVAIALTLDFNETQRGKVAIVVTELAKNLLKHATQGELILRALEGNDTGGIEILALDKGPGMANINQCLQDGFSTAGTSGNGLGAISRLCTFFDIHSIPGIGTVLVAQLGGPDETARKNVPFSSFIHSGLEIGVVSVPKTGEEVCGDGWSIRTDVARNVSTTGESGDKENSSDKILILVADGLGHGPMASEASQQAVRIFQENAHRGPKEIIDCAHAALRSTRGAAVAIASIDFLEQSVRFAGVGNIAGAIISGQHSQNMVSYNGTVGHQIRKFQEFVYPWPPGSLLVMHSDGLATQWRLDRYAGLTQKHPSLAAGVLYRDFKRSRDDVTVLVAKEIGRGGSIS